MKFPVNVRLKIPARQRGLFFFILCPLTMALLGCGGSDRPDLVPVTGTVHLDGKPLSEAVVSFLPVAIEDSAEFKRPSAAITDANGQFTLGTYTKTDGAPEGKYQVGIQKRELIGKLPEGYNEELPDATAPLKYRWVTPRKFADPKTSGLTAEITAEGLQPATIELTSDGPPEIETTGSVRSANEP